MESDNRKPKKKPRKIVEMTKEQIRQAMVRKQECNAKAQKIVESMLEHAISPLYFLECLAFINQSHMEDIIEERSIAEMCGYPLCDKTLSKTDIPKQRYRISTKSNKVYDITTRKSFCSNMCYEAAMYVKKQMLTSPLWCRDYEEIPTFQLMPVNSVASMGQEIVMAFTETVKTEPTHRDKFTCISDFAHASLSEMTNEESSTTNLKPIGNRPQHRGNEKNKGSNYKPETIKECEEETLKSIKTNAIEANHSRSDNELSTSNIKAVSNEKEKSPENKVATSSSKSLINVNEHSPENKIPTSSTKSLTEIPVTTRKSILKSSEKHCDKAVQKPKSIKKNSLNIVGEILEKNESKIDPILLDNPAPKKKPKKVVRRKQPSVNIITTEVEKCLAEWFTLDTLLFLFGEEKVCNMVADRGECVKEYLNNYGKSTFYTSNTYDQYQAICRKLNLLELEDKKFDAQTMQRETKPLPDYSILQEESQKMQLKVKAFYAGEMEIPDIEDTKKETVTEEDSENLTFLPLVDRNAQNALRRRIVCQHLNKVLPDLLRSLGLSTLTFSSEFRQIVNTFCLKANNIMFKPIQWILIALIIINSLSIHDKRLEFLLKEKKASDHMQLLLLSYKLDIGSIERLLIWLTDIDRILATNDNSNGVD